MTGAPSPVTHPRASGVQLHVTSLPGGRLGDEARRFVDWLAAAGQSVWQVLPVTVPDKHGSPYKSPSA
ncbi:MAG TPA: 4-alpha-glucanotransferase, partial [Nocardioides sp.]|nr:4-alpha-glucanotransferase [Nocardioides sp.]